MRVVGLFLLLATAWSSSTHKQRLEHVLHGKQSLHGLEQHSSHGLRERSTQLQEDTQTLATSTQRILTHNDFLKCGAFFEFVKDQKPVTLRVTSLLMEELIEAKRTAGEAITEFFKGEKSDDEKAYTHLIKKTFARALYQFLDVLNDFEDFQNMKLTDKSVYKKLRVWAQDDRDEEVAKVSLYEDELILALSIGFSVPEPPRTASKRDRKKWEEKRDEFATKRLYEKLSAEELDELYHIAWELRSTKALKMDCNLPRYILESIKDRFADKTAMNANIQAIVETAISALKTVIGTGAGIAGTSMGGPVAGAIASGVANTLSGVISGGFTAIMGRDFKVKDFRRTVRSVILDVWLAQLVPFPLSEDVSSCSVPMGNIIEQAANMLDHRLDDWQVDITYHSNAKCAPLVVPQIPQGTEMQPWPRTPALPLTVTGGVANGVPPTIAESKLTFGECKLCSAVLQSSNPRPDSLTCVELFIHDCLQADSFMKSNDYRRFHTAMRMIAEDQGFNLDSVTEFQEFSTLRAVNSLILETVNNLGQSGTNIFEKKRDQDKQDQQEKEQLEKEKQQQEQQDQQSQGIGNLEKLMRNKKNRI